MALKVEPLAVSFAMAVPDGATLAPPPPTFLGNPIALDYVLPRLTNATFSAAQLTWSRDQWDQDKEYEQHITLSNLSSGSLAYKYVRSVVRTLHRAVPSLVSTAADSRPLHPNFHRSPTQDADQLSRKGRRGSAHRSHSTRRFRKSHSQAPKHRRVC